MTTERWRLKGNYFENCNCQILCPCVLPVAPGDPTDGHCDVAMAFRIDEGAFNGVSLDGLRFAFTPGNMGAADWTPPTMWTNGRHRSSEPLSAASCRGIWAGRWAGGKV